MEYLLQTDGFHPNDLDLDELPHFFEWETETPSSIETQAQPQIRLDPPQPQQPLNFFNTVKHNEPYSNTLGPQTPFFNNFSGPSNMVVENEGFTLSLSGLPEKSRVETQMKMVLRLQDASGLNCQTYTDLEIDDNLIADQRRKGKKCAQKPKGASNTLTLTAVVVDSKRQKEIKRCVGCTQRERKALERRNKAQKNGAKIATECLALDEEKHKTLQFYCDPKVSLNGGEAVLPIRITCYCRHHQEKNGFSVAIHLHDGNNLVASAYSSLVMITDDHKMAVSKPVLETPSTGTDPKSGPQKKRARVDPEDTGKNLPAIEKLIPVSGPQSGGIEVTILGKHFYSGLSCAFGNSEAMVTTTWGPTTMVATLPSSLVAGPVHVCLIDRQQGISTFSHDNPIIFTYVNNSDRQLLELALQVIGMKLTGRIADPTSVAMQIVSESQSQGYNGTTFAPAPGGMNFAVDSSEQLVDNLIDVFQKVYRLNNEIQLEFSHQDESGHQLLHYAVLLNSKKLLDFLLSFISEEAFDIDVQDSNGWTALHFAASHSNFPFVKELVEHGACVLLPDERGDLPVHVTEDEAIIEFLQARRQIQEGEHYPHIPIQKPVVKDVERDEASCESSDDIVLTVTEEPTNPNLGSYDLPPVAGILDGQVTKELVQGQTDGTLLTMWFAFLKTLLFEFWESYRVFIYLGVLAATGTWTFVDYLPRFTSKGTVLQIPRSSNLPLYTFCNPPTPDCADPSKPNPGEVIKPPVSVGLTARSYEIKGYPSATAYFLNFGQYILFILSLLLIIFHFKDVLGPWRFWILFLMIAFLGLTGALFIFDVFAF